MDEINENSNIFDLIDVDNVNEMNSENNENEFNIEEESLEDISDNLLMNPYIHQYDKSKYILKDIITIMMNSNILSNNVICSQCHKLMKLTDNKSYKDGLIL